MRGEQYFLSASEPFCTKSDMHRKLMPAHLILIFYRFVVDKGIDSLVAGLIISLVHLNAEFGTPRRDAERKEKNPNSTI